MKPFQNILCPVDFSDDSYKAIEQASFLARMLQADLTLLHVVRRKLPAALGVVKGSDQSSQSIIDQATDDARTLLREAKRKYVPFAITCKSNIRYGKRVKEIVQEAKERNSNLILLPYPADLSTANQIISDLLKEASCPVMIYRHPDQHKGFRRFLVGFPHTFDFKPLGHFLHDHFALMVQELHLLAPAESEEAYQLINEAKWLSSLNMANVSIQAEAKPSAFAEEVAKTMTERKSHLLVMAYPESRDRSGQQMLSKILEKVAYPILVWKEKQPQIPGPAV